MNTIVLFLLAILPLTGCGVFEKRNQACYKDHCYTIELAVTIEEKQKGLQRRDFLPKNSGMLFVLDDRSVPRFWMKDTFIPLDMVWLDYSGRILGVEHAVSPCEKDPCRTYSPSKPAAYMLEINAGEASRLDMRAGDRIDIRIQKRMQ